MFMIDLMEAKNEDSSKDLFDIIFYVSMSGIEEKMKFLTHDKLLPHYQVPNICMV